jgi:signal transduction histidine kinase
VQEALTNVARHARASRAWVRVTADAEQLVLEVGDDGQGLPEVPPGEPTGQTKEKRVGRGLEGIRERVRLLNGELSLSRPEGGGLLLRAVVPLGDDESELSLETR